jgi:hypothetical protein
MLSCAIFLLVCHCLILGEACWEVGKRSPRRSRSFELDFRAPRWRRALSRGESIVVDSTCPPEHPTFIIPVTTHDGLRFACLPSGADILVEACQTLGVFCDNKNGHRPRLEPNSLVDYPRGAVATFRYKDDSFTHVAEVMRGDKDVVHCLSEIGIAHAQAGLVKMMAQARGGGLSTPRIVISPDLRASVRQALTAVEVIVPVDRYMAQFDATYVVEGSGASSSSSIREAVLALNKLDAKSLELTFGKCAIIMMTLDPSRVYGL